MPPDHEENPNTIFTLPEGNPKRKMAILDQILADSRRRLPDLQVRAAALYTAAGSRETPPRFLAGVRDAERVAVIGEVKRRSPSLGAINESLDPVGLASAYEAGGAAAISVLTEEARFGGSIADLDAISRAVRLPTLRKDFIVNELQVVEARAAGASAVLLIVRALDDDELASMLEVAHFHGLAALVEVHNRAELDRAVRSGASIIGVNARDLDTLEIDIPASLALIAEIPGDRIAVAESGMHSAADVRRAAQAGADAVLVGSSLAAAADPLALTRELSGVKRSGR